jgi:uncharacterized repeat protein (TIGR02543 family)
MNTYRTLNATKAPIAMLFTALLPLCPTASVAIQFASPVSYPVGMSPAAVVVADFNGDGHPDIAVANSGSRNVSVLINSGDGTFKPAATFDAGMASPTSIEVADFNNDGIQDLAVWTLSGPIGSTLSILLGNGDGTFKAPKTTPLAAGVNQATLDVAIADFNLDHKPDLALLVQDPNSGTLKILLLAGNSDGTFQSPQQSSEVLSIVVGSNVRYLVTEDFNNDAKPDLAVEYGTGLTILLGRGDGTFQTGASVSGDLSRLPLGDFNGDGRVDLLAVFSSHYQCGYLGHYHQVTDWRLDLIPGNGDGSFQAGEIIDAIEKSCSGSSWSPIGLYAVGDFNGDGRLDLLYQIKKVVNGVDGTFTRILLGRADGALSRPGSIDMPSSIPCVPCFPTLIAKDLNGDKLSDLIYLDSGNNAVVVVLNTSPTSGADLGIIGSVNGSIYEALIINLGPESASEVTFKDTLPTNSVYPSSATTTQGSCAQSNGAVTCAIGSLAPGFDVEVSVPVPAAMGPNATDGAVTITNNMNVTAVEPDLAPSNSTATQTQDSTVFTVRVAVADTGSGTVTINPTGINCGAVCSQHYLSGSPVGLTPTASPGFVFTGWTGDCNFADPSGCTFLLSSDISVTAKFEKATTPPAPSGDPVSGGGGALAWWELCGMLLVGLWRTLSGSQPMREYTG